MSLISLVKINKDFGIKPLFTELSLVVKESERIGIIGANGTGKSTLLKIMTGLEDPDSGEVVSQKGTQITYVEQQELFDGSKTLFEGCKSKVLSHDKECDIQDYEITQGLNLGGFIDLDQKIAELSGGQRKRLAIISAFLTKPNAILLDEPTNHLDIDSILWLEDYIEKYRGACVFISHDRYFIERVATRVIELDPRYPGGYLSAPGGYSAILEKRDLYLSQLASYQASLKNKVSREVDWLRQGAKARTTKAQYRIDEAHRLISELNSIDLNQEKAELGFSPSQRRTKELIKVEGISKTYGDRTLFKNVTFTIVPGARVGIVGANGSGKTTLLKTLIGEIKPDSGKITTAPNLQVSYFSQLRDSLDETLTVKKALCPEGDAVVFEGRQIHIITWAKRFLFQTDDLNRTVGSLSGGEKAKVLLAKVALEKNDILIFDEPTNDLDIQTLEILEKSFTQYPGGLVLVTHDRYLLDRACTSVIGFKENGVIEVFADYTQYEISKKEKSKKPVLSDTDKKELKTIEKKIYNTETKIAGTNAKMELTENSQDHAKLGELTKQLMVLEKELGMLMQRWEELEG